MYIKDVFQLSWLKGLRTPHISSINVCVAYRQQQLAHDLRPTEVGLRRHRFLESYTWTKQGQPFQKLHGLCCWLCGHKGQAFNHTWINNLTCKIRRSEDPKKVIGRLRTCIHPGLEANTMSTSHLIDKKRNVSKVMLTLKRIRRYYMLPHCHPN